MKNLLLPSVITAFVVFSSSSVLAAPTHCPSLPIIKLSGLSFVQQDCGETTYGVGHLSNYATPIPWMFVIDHIPAKNIEEAKKKGLIELKTVYGNPKPEFDSGFGNWVCRYNIPQPAYTAIAVAASN